MKKTSNWKLISKIPNANNTIFDLVYQYAGHSIFVEADQFNSWNRYSLNGSDWFPFPSNWSSVEHIARHYNFPV